MGKKIKKQIKSSNIVDHFAHLEDPRIERTKRHKLIDIVVIAICAVVCGADGWVDIQAVGEAKYRTRSVGRNSLSIWCIDIVVC